MFEEDMVAHSYNLNTWVVEDQEFKVRYIESLRPAWATCGPFLKKQKQKQIRRNRYLAFLQKYEFRVFGN